MRKIKRTCIISLVVLVVASSLGGCTETRIIKETKGYTYEQVLVMFQNNETKFEEINKILLSNSNDGFRKSPEEATIFCYSNSAEKYFTKDDWAKIEQVFYDTGPYEIRRYQNSVVGYCYMKENHNAISYNFYHFDDYTDYGYHTQLYSKVLDLGNDWCLAYDVKY